MNSFTRLGPARFSASVLAILLSSGAAGATQRQIIRPVDETQRVALRGNTRPEATPENDLGPVADDLSLQHMQLLLQRPPALQRQLDAYTESLSDKSSPEYHHWLTPDQFGERFGVAQEDIDAVTDWLTLHGLEVNFVYPNRMSIDFSGTAALVRDAFLTEIHAYDVHGARHIANDSDPQIPAALAPAVAGIVSLHDFLPRPMLTPRAQFTFNNGSEQYAMTPPDLATTYNLAPLFKGGHSGKGETIAVIEDSNLYSAADWTAFRKKFGLSGYTAGSLKQIHPAPKTGSNNCSNPGVNADGDDEEATIDAEYASAAAPDAAVEVVSCNNTSTTFGGQIALQNLLNGVSKPPALVSISYGDCESDNGAAANAALSSLYQQATVEGVSVFVSSGDEGAASCDANQESATHGISISGWASTPYNVAVGGTDFEDTYLNEVSTYWHSSNSADYESARSYIPEIPWNDSCASKLIAEYESNSSLVYGSKGFCNSSNGEDNFLTVVSGSGGPSACAQGAPSTPDVTSASCKGWPKPKWQSLLGVPSDDVRDIPDVSLFAANGIWGHYYIYCFSDLNNGGSPCNQSPANWAAAGGTSFASPIMAGIQALVVQKWGRQGNPNPVLYKMAKSEYGSKGTSSCKSSLGKNVGSSCVFYDVTVGDMDDNCTGSHNCYRPSGANGVLSTSSSSYKPAFQAASGWDFATGIGTINAYNLVYSKDW